MSKSYKIMIVAGEPSGDAHGAKLVRALRESGPADVIEFFGAAGPKMRGAGVEAVVRSDGLSIVGLAEIGAALPMFLKAFGDLKRAAVSRKPDVVVLIDFPDFNLRLARTLKKQGFPVVYYISPQLWAWRKHRVGIVKSYVDLMLTILPFEKDWYAKHGVDKVEYVGSPLAREVHSDVEKSVFCADHLIDPAKPIIALLPGSRRKEIDRILPVMLDTANKLASTNHNIQFFVALSSNRHLPFTKAQIDKMIIKTRGNTLEPKIVVNKTYNVLSVADAAAVTSGTATLEGGVIGTPMAIVYKTSGLNYKILEPLIDVPHYGLINLIAGKRVATELIQNNFTAAALSHELLRLLDPAVNSAMRAELKIAADMLGRGGASKRAAGAILKFVDGRKV